jgi:hypothetical protein
MVALIRTVRACKSKWLRVNATRIDARLACMQRAIFATAADPDRAGRPAIAMTASGRHWDESEYGRLLQAFGDACAEANRRGMLDHALEGERHTEG